MTVDKVKQLEDRLKVANDRNHQFDKLLKGMELDLKTLGVLLENTNTDLAKSTPEATEAAKKLVETMQCITACYR
jgi:hypothetical protein